MSTAYKTRRLVDRDRLTGDQERRHDLPALKVEVTVQLISLDAMQVDRSEEPQGEEYLRIKRSDFGLILQEATKLRKELEELKRLHSR
jgi:hypothetical protein